MDKTWILVASASMATLYDYASPKSINGKPTLNTVKEFAHPDSRKKDRNLTSDRQGAFMSSGSYGTFVDSSDPHQYEAEVFAHQLVQALEQGRVDNQYQALVLVSAPHFLGLLRKSIDDHPLKKMPIHEVEKDYTKNKPHELIELLNLKNLSHR